MKNANTTLGVLLLKFDDLDEMLHAMDNVDVRFQVEVE